MTCSHVQGIRIWVYLGVISLPTTRVHEETVGSDHSAQDETPLWAMCILQVPTGTAELSLSFTTL